jgi:hypothetical protein
MAKSFSKKIKMLRVSFLGDISLNNIYNDLYASKVNPFKKISRELTETDFNIGNLECLASSEYGENLLKNPRLKTKLETLNLLKHLNLGAVTLAHNHVYDNLKDGYDKSVRFLNSQKIKSVGAGLNLKIAEHPLIIQNCGIKLGLLNFVAYDTNPKIPIDAEVCVNYFNLTKIKNQIKQIKGTVDHIIILLHWGGKVEEGFYPDFDQPTLAKKMIDGGADLIIGGHSHTVQPYEKYKGKYIFYSLGNFCFDDIVQDNEVFQIGKYRKRKTIIVSALFTKSDYSIKVFHAINKNGFIIPNNTLSEKIKLSWRNLLFKIIKRNYCLWQIYYWHLKKIVPIKMYFIEANEGFIHQFINLDYKRALRYLLKK